MRFPVIILCAALAACATPTKPRTPETRWVARSDADLKKDLADCQSEADHLDFQALSNAGDSRYGPAIAMANQVANNDVRGVTMHDVILVARDSCMVAKGWKKAE